jgi:hypothetical protein
MLDNFHPTPERDAIIERLEKAQAALQEAAELLATDLVASGRSRVITNLAQHVSARKSLIAQDWSLADEAGGGARPA